jgi:hypothetical protein
MTPVPELYAYIQYIDCSMERLNKYIINVEYNMKVNAF